MADQSSGPRYEGLVRYTAPKLGFALWLPSDWRLFKLGAKRRGVIFSPYTDDISTSFSAEKIKLPIKIKKEDVPALRDGFKHGLASLAGVSIESHEEVIEQGLVAFDAKLTFREGDETRKRWTRVVYAGNAQLTLIAQGRSPEDFDYWLPMFFNTMMTLEI